MPLYDNKCHAIAFGNKTSFPSYKLGITSLEWVEETKHLGVTIQTNLKFDKHIEHKTRQASKVLGMVKFMLYDAPRQARLLAYTSLCHPILECADAVWDPSLKKTVNDIEMVQNRAVRFISRLKGHGSVGEARCELGLQILQERHKNHRLTRILQAEDMHSTLSSAYEELVDNHIVTMTQDLQPVVN